MPRLTDPAKLARITEAFVAGERASAICEREGYNRRALYKLLARHGVTREPPGRVDWTPDMDATLTRLRARGWGVIRIGHAIDVAPATVANRINRLGLPRFTRGKKILSPPLDRG